MALILIINLKRLNNTKVIVKPLNNIMATKLSDRLLNKANSTQDSKLYNIKTHITVQLLQEPISLKGTKLVLEVKVNIEPQLGNPILVPKATKRELPTKLIKGVLDSNTTKVAQVNPVDNNSTAVSIRAAEVNSSITQAEEAALQVTITNLNRLNTITISELE